MYHQLQMVVAILGATTFLVMRMHHVPMVLEAAGISPEVV